MAKKPEADLKKDPKIEKSEDKKPEAKKPEAKKEVLRKFDKFN